jgi:hypothetical protein
MSSVAQFPAAALAHCNATATLLALTKHSIHAMPTSTPQAQQMRGKMGKHTDPYPPPSCVPSSPMYSINVVFYFIIYYLILFAKIPM